MTSSHLSKKREFALGESLLAQGMVLLGHVLAALAVLLLPDGLCTWVAVTVLALSLFLYFVPFGRRRNQRGIRRLTYRENLWTVHSAAGEQSGELAGYKLGAESVLLKLRLEQGQWRRLVIFRDQLSLRDWRRLRTLLTMS